MKILTLFSRRNILGFVVIFNLGVAYSQEICDNAKDDDGDGLIDLNDSDCSCTGTVDSMVTIVKNPSFEEHSQKPTTSGQIEYATGWFTGTSGSPDYMRADGWNQGLPTPYPDGEGATNLTLGIVPREYIATCLTHTLKANEEATMKFFVAAATASNFDVTVFGSGSCNNSFPVNTNDCPEGNGDWHAIGKAPIQVVANQWYEVEFKIKSTKDINAIMIGGSCNTTVTTFYAIDWLRVQVKYTGEDSIQVDREGSLCTDNLVLKASSTLTGGKYQWYLDGVAIVGQTNASLDVSGNNLGTNGAGNYSVTYNKDSSCIRGDLTVNPPVRPIADFSCAESGGTISFTDASITTDGQITQWQWDFTSDGNVDSQGQNPSFTSTGSNAHTTLIVTTSLGCSDTITKNCDSATTGPEDCADGIDNDGDGLVDLNDPDCPCNVDTSTTTTTKTIPSLIPNPSFEEHTCVPSYFEELNCAKDWVQATAGTSDYFHSNSYNPLPVPFPEGIGAAGFAPVGREFIGACLDQPLPANTEGLFQLYFVTTGLKMVGFQVEACDFLGILPDIDITVYGSPNCSELPLTTMSNCPTGNGTWTEVGKITYSPSNNWELIEIKINSTADINAIIIGGPCNPAAEYLNRVGCTPYFGVDGLIVNETSAFTSGIAQELTITPSGSSCSNDLILNAASPDSGGKWQWFQDGAALPGETNASLDVSGGGLSLNSTYNVTYSANGSCVRKDYSLSSQTLSAQFNFDAACVGNPVKLEDKSTVNTGKIASWSWDFDSDGTQDAQTQDAVFTPSGSGPFTTTLTVVSDSGCVDSISQTYSLSSVTANFEWEGACANTEFKFTDSSTANGSDQISAWTWIFGAGQSATTQNCSHTFTSAGSYPVMLISTSNMGCVDTVINLIEVHPQPAVSVLSFKEGCGEVCLDLEAVPVMDNNGQTAQTTEWNWSFPDGTSSDKQQPTHCFKNNSSTTKEYFASLITTSDVGCRFADTFGPVAKVLPIPTANFFFAPGHINLWNTEVTFYNTSSADAIRYGWNFGNVGSSAEESPVFEFPDDSARKYHVYLIATNSSGCSDTTINTVTINQNSKFYVPNAFSPNGDGVNDIFIPKFQRVSTKNYSLLIFNRWGNIVYHSKSPYIGWDGTEIEGLNPAKQDTYIWVISLTERESKMNKTYSGHINLIR